MTIEDTINRLIARYRRRKDVRLRKWCVKHTTTCSAAEWVYCFLTYQSIEAYLKSQDKV